MKTFDVPLRGAAVWAAYGTLEALFAIGLRRVLFAAAFVPPDDRYTLFLLILYPLAGALLGRFAMAGLAIAFAANAIAIVAGPSLAVPIVSAAIAAVVRPPRDLAPDQPPPRVASPNIVLIVMDTVRADHLSAYGYGRNTTPNLARFAKSATLYARVYAPANMTLPSHASLFTGLYGSEHTAHYDDGWPIGRPLPAQALTAAELLSARGYATACIAANGYLGEGFGLDQGFQHHDVRAPAMPYGLAADFYLRSRIAVIASRVIKLNRRGQLLSRDADEITGLALAYLDRTAGKRRPIWRSGCSRPSPPALRRSRRTSARISSRNTTARSRTSTSRSNGC